jgi:23S rRNA (cytidine1920-2'-O)/16S rRNA (cytidine1409-2'-O)-methyltransferase
MLKEGAAKVYAVDVGYGQFDYALRKDPRVMVMEKTNVRALARASFPESIGFFTADLSFISIVKVFDAIRDSFSPVEGVILIKPQFEAGPGDHKKGVVRKPDAHREILVRVLTALAEKGMLLKGLVHSPIRGPKGNIEFLAHCVAGESVPAALPDDTDRLVADVVAEAHRSFVVAPEDEDPV